MEGLKLSQPLPLRGPWQVPDPSNPCVFGTCIAYHSNMNYLVPFPEACNPPPPPPPLSYKTPPRSFRHLAFSITQHKFSANTPLSNYASIPTNHWSRGLVPGFHTDIHPTPSHSTPPPPNPKFYSFSPTFAQMSRLAGYPSCPGILVRMVSISAKHFSSLGESKGVRWIKIKENSIL